MYIPQSLSNSRNKMMYGGGDSVTTTSIADKRLGRPSRGWKVAVSGLVLAMAMVNQRGASTTSSAFAAGHRFPPRLVFWSASRIQWSLCNFAYKRKITVMKEVRLGLMPASDNILWIWWHSFAENDFAPDQRMFCSSSSRPYDFDHRMILCGQTRSLWRPQESNGACMLFVCLSAAAADGNNTPGSVCDLPVICYYVISRRVDPMSSRPNPRFSCLLKSVLQVLSPSVSWFFDFSPHKEW